jgi:hypothetical protein
MKKRLISLVLLALSFNLCLLKPAFSAPVSLFGVPDCGQWVNRKSEPDKAWLLGYVSGLNFKHVEKGGTNALETVNSADQMFVWMTNYCQKNPMSKLSDAGFEMFQELLIKAIIKETSESIRKESDGSKK